MLLQEKLIPASLYIGIDTDWERDIIAHSFRLVEPAQAISRELGLPREVIYRLGLAALLHDLGKFSIPQAILEKPGPLSAEEWQHMRRHPEIGCSILQQAGDCWGSVAFI